MHPDDTHHKLRGRAILYISFVMSASTHGASQLCHSFFGADVFHSRGPEARSRLCLGAVFRSGRNRTEDKTKISRCLAGHVNNGMAKEKRPRDDGTLVGKSSFFLCNF